MNAIANRKLIEDSLKKVRENEQRALASAEILRAAAEEQVQRAQEFRASIDRLDDVFKRMEKSWKAYDKALDTINFKPLQRNAKGLSSIMDDWIDQADASKAA